MNVATSPVRAVGVRELKNSLSHYLERVRAGEELVVTDRGRPVAKLMPTDASSDRLADLVNAGLVRPPRSNRRRLPKAISANGIVSDLVPDQRR